MLAELKYVWDNFFKNNDSLVLVLCGSSPPFIINKILHSKALYNRSQHELPLHEFSLAETKMFLGGKRSAREIMDAYLTVGGIPEYLKYVNMESSIFLGLCKNSFTNGGFFLNEYERIFTSSLGSDRNYSKIVDFLSKRKFATRNEIAKHLKTNSGGTLTDLLTNLELCGFITKYSPFNLGEQSALTRYNISDHYIQFYFKFIAPFYHEIQNGKFNKNPATPINMDTYNKWLGLGFERFCRKYHHIFAHLLGFEAVSYRAGTFFNRRLAEDQKGFQIDLMYERADRVYTICELKYLQSPATVKVAEEFEKRLQNFPNPKRYTIHKVLISGEGADKQLAGSRYFDRILTLNDITEVTT